MKNYLRADLGENDFGYWFKLDPIQHAYEIQFAERLAQRGLEANGGGKYC